jgi:HK97 family phage major capsid protein
MNKTLRALLQKKEGLIKDARAITGAAEAAGRELTDAETTQHAALVASLQSVNASIARESELIEAEQSLQIPAAAAITGGAPRIEQDPKRGFSSFGEFASALISQAVNHTMDDRLRIGAAAPSTYGNEASGTDGGFAVPPTYGNEIWQMSLEEDAFLPLTDNMPIGGNSMVFPSDETTPWGTDGVRAYWEGEAEAANATKPKLNPNSMRLKKLMALVPMSDELLQDAPALSSYLMRKVGESIRYKTNDAIINGNGVGRPMGMSVAASLVTQAKEGSQVADTIVAANITKMFSRLINPGRGYWLINPDAYPQLPLLTIGDQPMYVGPNGLQNASGGTLLGRPVILTDTCQTLGNLGDIAFANFGMYRTLTKTSGLETATSMHLYFDAAATAFRAVFRIDGQPVLKSAITPPNSAVTRSNFVNLAERA